MNETLVQRFQRLARLQIIEGAIVYLAKGCSGYSIAPNGFKVVRMPFPPSFDRYVIHSDAKGTIELSKMVFDQDLIFSQVELPSGRVLTIADFAMPGDFIPTNSR